MGRASPLSPAPQWQAPQQNEGLTLRLKVITPLFGGGYEPREVDPVCIIRPATIRGHLRFWWRALYGGQYASSEALFRAESALWGAAAVQQSSTAEDKKEPSIGKVAIRVTVTNKGKPQKCADYVKDQASGRYRSVPKFAANYPPYALYPFQGQLEKGGRQVKDEPASAREGVEFEITLICSKDLSEESYKQVLSAIAAWVRYGGIGARTRRGCGSLELVSSEPLPLKAGSAPNTSNIPLLPGARLVIGNPTSDPLQAWRQAVEIYRDFRQSVPFARNPGTVPGRPGRSKYPEPDSIRRKTGNHASQHPPTHPVQSGFPRADLGLPIVFHFKDKGDPPDNRLQGFEQGRLRMASPVITKAIADGAGEYRPMVMVLNAPHAWDMDNLHLVVNRNNNSQVLTVIPAEVQLNYSELKKIAPLSGKPIREALLDFVASKWGAKVEEWKP